MFLKKAEFRELVDSMKIEVEIDKLLYNVDPFNHQQITFSQLVTLFSSVYNKNNHKKITSLNF